MNIPNETLVMEENISGKFDSSELLGISDVEKADFKPKNGYPQSPEGDWAKATDNANQAAWDQETQRAVKAANGDYGYTEQQIALHKLEHDLFEGSAEYRCRMAQTSNTPGQAEALKQKREATSAQQVTWALRKFKAS